MDIGFIHPRWPGGEGTGAAHSATQVVLGLRDRGHAVTAYCKKQPPTGDMNVEGIDCVPLDLDRFPHHDSTVFNRAIMDWIDDLGDHDLVHGYSPSTLPALTRIAVDTPAATVATLNAYAGVCPKNDLLYRGREQCRDNSPGKCVECILRTSRGNGVGHWAKRSIGRLGNLRMVRKGLSRIESIDGFRAPSGHVKEHYVHFGFPGERIEVIPHPLDECFLVEHTSDFREPFRLLYVGSLEPQKGVDKLVPIVDRLRQMGVDVELTVVGEGQERTKMERQADDANVGQWIDFRGRVLNQNLPAVYADHDILIHPGIWEEPLARVYIEALATGTPIVTTEYGDVGTVIGDGGVTTDGSVNGFVDALEDILAEDRLAELSQGGKRTVSRYDPDGVIDRIETMYRRIGPSG